MVVALGAAAFIGHKYATRYGWLPGDQASGPAVPAELLAKAPTDQGVQTTNVKKSAPLLADPPSLKEEPGATTVVRIDGVSSVLPASAAITVAANPSQGTVGVKTPSAIVDVVAPQMPQTAVPVEPVVQKPAQQQPASAAPSATALAVPRAAAPRPTNAPPAAAPVAEPVAPPKNVAPQFKKVAATSAPRKSGSYKSSQHEDTWDGASRIF